MGACLLSATWPRGHVTLASGAHFLIRRGGASRDCRIPAISADSALVTRAIVFRGPRRPQPSRRERVDMTMAGRSLQIARGRLRLAGAAALSLAVGMAGASGVVWAQQAPAKKAAPAQK